MSQSHRGPDPQDEVLFGAAAQNTLRSATQDLCWLLDHGYALVSSTTLVGDRFLLTRRQRQAMARCACSRVAKERRQNHHVSPQQLAGRELWIDGFNVLITLETALGGGVILGGRDGCCRDVAGIFSNYHRVEETVPALHAVGRFLSALGVRKCRWWLDSPVSNSGRLKGFILVVAQNAGWPWEVELTTNPDKVLSFTGEIVCSSDHVILDQCQSWFNLACQVIRDQIPQARKMNLDPEADDSPKRTTGQD